MPLETTAPFSSTAGALECQRSVSGRASVSDELPCSPEYLRTLKIRTTEDLQRARLIYSSTRKNAWSEWRQCYDPQIAQLKLDEGFPHFYLLIQAARCGLGLANVPRMLVQDDLNSGTLVAPFGFIEGPHRLTIWVGPQSAERSETKRLVAWLSKELRADERQNRATP